MRHLPALTAACCAAVALPAAAQQPVPQEPVVVSATREETRVFDAPAAVGAVGGDVIGIAGPGVNLSEAINRIPGIAAPCRPFA